MNTLYTHQILPGITEKDWGEVEKKIEIIEKFSNKIHVDFIDNSFSDNKTFLDPSPFLKYKDLFLEAHLQVNEPLSFLDKLSKAGFKKFIGNIEHMASQEEFVAEAELLGETALGLNLKTPISDIKVPFEDIDSILLLCIPSNESGIGFDQSSIQKIKELRSKTFIPIEVDGGINDQTIVQCKDAGANLFVSTSFISGSQNPQEQFNKLQSLLRF